MCVQYERTAELMYQHAVENECSDKQGFINDLAATVHKYRGDDLLSLNKVSSELPVSADERAYLAYTWCL